MAWFALPCWLMLACADGSADTAADEPEPVSFAADVHPILLQKCAGSSCHSVSMGPFRPGHAAADVNEAYAATQQMGLMQQPVYRRMLARASSADPTLMMPPSWATPPCDGAVGTPGCLSEDELALLDAWVAQGAPP